MENTLAELKSLATYQGGYMRQLAKDLQEEMPETAEDILSLCDTLQALLVELDK